jgi:ADP-ribose pyrophosphatase
MLFSGLVVNIEQFEVRIGEKGWHTYQIVRHPGGVGVLPLHDDGTVTLIRQLRPAVGGTLLEIPAGRLQPGEDPAACGRREMAEETGLSAGELVPLGSFYPSPGVLDEVIHLFLGTGLAQGSDAPEHYEEIETVRLPLAEALRMACDDGIRDGKTIVALLRAGAVVR